MINSDIVITGSSGFIGTNLKNFFSKKKIKFTAYSRKKNSSFKYVKRYDQIKFKKNSSLIYLSQSNENTTSYKSEIATLKKLMTYDWKYIIYFSSIKVYKNNKKRIITENNPINLNNNYSKLKINSEKIIIKKKNSICLRISNIYGPYFNEKTLLDDILNNIYKKEAVSIRNKYEFVDFLNIDDLNQLVLILLKKEIKGIFNVAHGRSIEIEVLIKKILSILKLKKKIISKINKKKKIEIDISKIKKKTGWKPKKKIEKGLNEIFKKDMYFYRK